VSATIIPFPRYQAPSPVADTAPEACQQRLARALATLDEALAEQRSAVADWRDTLSALRAAVHGLGHSLDTYHTQLGRLASDVEGVNRMARQLEGWADSALYADDLHGT